MIKNLICNEVKRMFERERENGKYKVSFTKAQRGRILYHLALAFQEDDPKFNYKAFQDYVLGK